MNVSNKICTIFCYYYMYHIVIAGVFFFAVDLSGKIYQTNAALEKENLMFCYECNTMTHGKSCSNFTNKDDYSKYSTKCVGDKKTCMVK